MERGVWAKPDHVTQTPGGSANNPGARDAGHYALQATVCTRPLRAAGHLVLQATVCTRPLHAAGHRVLQPTACCRPPRAAGHRVLQATAPYPLPNGQDGGVCVKENVRWSYCLAILNSSLKLEGTLIGMHRSERFLKSP